MQMAVGTPSLAAQKFGGLDRERVVWIYRTMFLSRKLDEKQIQLHRQGRSFFPISAARPEALQIAAARSPAIGVIPRSTSSPAPAPSVPSGPTLSVARRLPSTARKWARPLLPA